MKLPNRPVGNERRKTGPKTKLITYHDYSTRPRTGLQCHAIKNKNRKHSIN